MRGRGLESWAHPKSGDFRQRFLTPSKAYSFFFPSGFYDINYTSMYRNVLLHCKCISVQKCLTSTLLSLPQFTLCQKLVSEPM